MRWMGLVLAGAAGCGGGAGVQGTIVDGMSGTPLAGVAVVAKAADPAASPTCATFDATTDDQGSFMIKGLCSGEYKLEVGDRSWWLADGDRLPDGGGMGLAFKAWRAPVREGIYELVGTEANAISGSSRIKEAKPYGQDTVVQYPDALPPKVALIEPGEHFLIAGKSEAEKTQFIPLINGPKIMVGEGEKTKNLLAWSYIGAKFTEKPPEEQHNRKRPDSEPPDYAVELVGAVTPDKSKMVRKEKGDRVAVYLAHDALPPGRYAVFEPEARMVDIIDFGKAGEMPAAE